MIEQFRGRSEKPANSQFVPFRGRDVEEYVRHGLIEWNPPEIPGGRFLAINVEVVNGALQLIGVSNPIRILPLQTKEDDIPNINSSNTKGETTASAGLTLSRRNQNSKVNLLGDNRYSVSIDFSGLAGKAEGQVKTKEGDSAMIYADMVNEEFRSALKDLLAQIYSDKKSVFLNCEYRTFKDAIYVYAINFITAKLIGGSLNLYEKLSDDQFFHRVALFIDQLLTSPYSFLATWLMSETVSTIIAKKEGISNSKLFVPNLIVPYVNLLFDRTRYIKAHNL